MTQAQDDTFIVALKAYTVGTTRPSQTQYTTFRAASKTWLASRLPPPPPPGPIPVVTSANFTLATGYGLDALVGQVVATNAPTSYAIVSGNSGNGFAIYPSANLRTSETVVAPPGNYALGVTATNANGVSAVGTINVFAQGGPPPPPPPPPTGFPDATTTGIQPGVVLSAPEPSITITQAGAVISGRSFTGQIDVKANNVTIRNCKIVDDGGYYGIYSGYDGSITGLTVEHCDISGPQYGIAGSGTFRFNNIYRVENSILFWPGPSLFEENYVHGLFYNVPDPHYDGVQIDGGNVSNVVIRHNNIINDDNQTSAVMIDNYFGNVDNVLVENNRLVGGAYTIFTDGRFNSSVLSNIRFINNRLGTGQYGYIAIWEKVVNGVWSGNVDDVTGAPVNP